ncbi:MAG: hypothetical protein V2A73_01390 [Pseudomonadota bacterium]
MDRGRIISEFDLVVPAPPVVMAALRRLVETGLFGKNIEAVAEELLREKVRELSLQGWLK